MEARRTSVSVEHTIAVRGTQTDGGVRGGQSWRIFRGRVTKLSINFEESISGAQENYFEEQNMVLESTINYY